MRPSHWRVLWAYTQTREAGAIMRIAGVVVVTEIALALVPSGFGADAVAWGPTVNGLRLGAAFGSDPSKPTLRVLLHNVGSEFQEVVIGHEAGGSVYDSLKFVATAPDENKREGFHRSVFTPIAGLVLPFSLRL